MNLVNLTNSPYPITLADGTKELLPARGRLDNVEPSAGELQQIRLCGYIRIEEGASGKAEAVESSPQTEYKPEPTNRKKRGKRK